MNANDSIKPRSVRINPLASVSFLLWMATAIFVYLILFGPPQFWSLSEKIGISNGLVHLRETIYPFFYEEKICITFPSLICD